jgi:hypothetical protein
MFGSVRAAVHSDHLPPADGCCRDVDCGESNLLLRPTRSQAVGPAVLVHRPPGVDPHWHRILKTVGPAANRHAGLVITDFCLTGVPPRRIRLPRTHQITGADERDRSNHGPNDKPPARCHNSPPESPTDESRVGANPRYRDQSVPRRLVKGDTRVAACADVARQHGGRPARVMIREILPAACTRSRPEARTSPVASARHRGPTTGLARKR